MNNRIVDWDICKEDVYDELILTNSDGKTVAKISLHALNQIQLEIQDHIHESYKWIKRGE